MAYKHTNNRITMPFQFVSRQKDPEIRHQLSLLNRDDEYFNELMSRSLLNMFTEELKIHLANKEIDVPIEILVSIYDHTLSTLLNYWVKNGRIESPQEMDQKFKMLLSPIFYM